MTKNFLTYIVLSQDIILYYFRYPTSEKNNIILLFFYNGMYVYLFYHFRVKDMLVSLTSWVAFDRKFGVIDEIIKGTYFLNSSLLFLSVGKTD